MKLRRIEVKDFRKLGHVVVDDLGDGLNVIVGNNEAGKSTLLAALRAVLFERHRVTGGAASAMQPYNQAVRPEITLDFERDGSDWRLHKAFSQRPHAELTGNGERYMGDAAEEKLATMLGFTPPGRGESKPDEHHGIFGLLWVEQGTSHRPLGMGAGRNHLASALESEVGQITGGERGRYLLAAAETRKSEFWDKRDNPRGEYKTLIADLAQLKLDKAAAEQRLAAHDDKVARLASLQSVLARHRDNNELQRAQTRAAEALLSSERVGKLSANAATAAAALNTANLRRDAAATRKQARDAQIARTLGTAATLEAAKTHAAEIAAILARFTDTLTAAEHANAQAAAAVQTATLALATIERAKSRRQTADAIAQLTGQIAAATDIDTARRQALAIAAAIPLTANDLTQLDANEKARDEARLRVQAASVRITLKPSGTNSATIDGAPVSLDHDLSLARDTEITLQGYGTIAIHPGGGVGALARTLEQAESDLHLALQRLGHPDSAAARAALARKTDAARQAESAKAAFATLAPKGLEPLHQQLASLTLQLGDDTTAPTDPTPDAIDAARQHAQTATTLLAQRASELSEINGALATRRPEAAVANDRLATAARSAEQSATDLATARAQLSDDDLIEALRRETEQSMNARDHDADAREALTAADPEATGLKLKAANAAAKSIADDIARTEQERRDIAIELQALGTTGLGELLSQLEGELILREARLTQTHLEAEAAKLLHLTLATAQRETKEKWLAPVRERSAPYLRLIQKDTSIELHEDTLEIDQLVRNGVAEPFGGLSVGAREQIAVITRLALADILREAGQQSCVVLDDALVNTDETRLEAMHLVLHKAALNQQVLILTCRERDFLQLGAPIRRM